MSSTDGPPRAAGTRAEARALFAAAAMAGRAPSIHNTQPWRWRLTADELNLHLDHSRALDVTDPDSRLAIMSCGATLHHALVSLAADGWHAGLARMPDPAHPDHLARLRLGRRIPVRLEARRHRQTIGLRHTGHRSAVSAAVDTGNLHAVSVAAESAGAGLHLLHPDQVHGLARAAVPDRDFGRHGDLPVSETPGSAAALAILYGSGDDEAAWLHSGEALSAAWLTATELACRSCR
ncbi:hypothetical protein AB0G04_33095 [Actinoplanes sp. NPDC023801]|uniref:hypothetical protein n=1 Tax=Actinoplanes sp. NPDC023801 TaxID=3154595 RepID=UPI003403AE11